MTTGPAGRYRRGPARVHDVRRIRDLLRFAVLGGGYPDGQLPSESELMAVHGAARATVREALALLRAEGLVERTQGVGTHVVTRAVTTRLAEAHGVAGPAEPGMFGGAGIRPRLLDRSVIPAPPTVTRRLGVPPGSSCLRVDYVALMDDEPVGLATNYVAFPEAGRLVECPFRSDWYTFMDHAGVEFGESEFIIGCELADAATAAELGVGPGTPVISLEQTISDRSGRPFDLAFIYTLGRQFRFVSRALRYPRGAENVE
ncbi:MAG TPA: GntR family transcriptional regulator [Trebonia sp.]|nr:GntR family transcriptional regulator [Trebonia sp.]